MRFGCCVGVPAQPSNGTGFEIIEQLARMGYDYIELPLAQVMDLPETEFASLTRHLELTGLRSEALNVFFPRRIRLTGEDVVWDQVQAYAQEAITRAAQLGAQVLVLGSAGSRNVPEGFGREKAWDQLVHVLRLLDPIAGKHGITIAIEPLNKGESNIINTVQEALALAREAGRPNVQVLVDYYHLSLEREALEHLSEAGSAIRHAHFAWVEGRRYPFEVDDSSRAFFRALKAIGYQGRVSIEAGTQDILADAPKALEVLRQLGR